MILASNSATTVFAQTNGFILHHVLPVFLSASSILYWVVFYYGLTAEIIWITELPTNDLPKKVEYNQTSQSMKTHQLWACLTLMKLVPQEIIQEQLQEESKRPRRSQDAC